VLRDLEAETLGQNQRELMELRATAQQLVDRITLVVRGET
jgi:hypothetical protein